MTDQAILNQLEKEKVLVFTPARRIGGKRVVCYDDRYILKLAVDTDGIVVSNDNYRDLLDEKEEFKKVIEERLLMYSFVNDRYFFDFCYAGINLTLSQTSPGLHVCNRSLLKAM